MDQDQKDIAIRNAITAFEFTEMPVLKYISKLLNLDIKEIYEDKFIHSEGSIDFKLRDKTYAIKLQVCDSDYKLSLPCSIPEIKSVLQHMGYMVFIIKKTTYNSIITSKHTSNLVKTKLTRTKIEFDEDKSSLYVINFDKTPYSSLYSLGFVITELNVK